MQRMRAVDLLELETRLTEYLRLAAAGERVLVKDRDRVVARALQPFPKPVRTLDALHLATAHYLAQRSADLTLATDDHRMAEVARLIGPAASGPHQAQT